ncbi:MAG: lipid-A-disaccharide synthase [Bacteroidales bacterium]
MKYYIIAGEASGDLHASNLMKELKVQDPSAQFRCWGGDLMQAAGGELVKHYRSLAFMGFTEVLLNLSTILGNLSFCRKDISEFKPDALILVDYPGFNLRIAKFAHQAGFKVFYYISPQVWAWKQSRVHSIKKYVHRMFVILPFEKEFYARFGIDVDFVGHPLHDAIAGDITKTQSDEFRNKHRIGEQPVIALLPGSRKQEIERVLPVMLEVVPDFRDYQFVVAGVSSVGLGFYDKIIKGSDVRILFDETRELLRNSQTALVTSGTATLETAMIGIPQVVCYKGGQLSYLIARQLIKVPFISLVNLIAGRQVIEELIQQKLNRKTLSKSLARILPGHPDRTRILADYQELNKLLGSEKASQKTASLIISYL